MTRHHRNQHVPEAYLAHAQQQFLNAEEVEDFVNACNTPLRQSIRINSLKINHQDFLLIAKKYGWKLTPIPWCSDGFWLEASSSNNSESQTEKNNSTLLLGNTPEHIQGLFYIQEASSMLPPVALFNNLEISNPKDLMVLDMAAAPGSKTTQIAALLKNQGHLIANELSSSRLKVLYSNVIRCGIMNTSLCHLDATKFADLTPKTFDFILLDAPCTGEGTVRKHLNALDDWSIDNIEKAAMLQKELLKSAYIALKPGGRLVYSTCTLSYEENHFVADYLVKQTSAQIEPLDQLFVDAYKVASKQGYLHLLPHQFDSEGFFIACFSKPQEPEISAPQTSSSETSLSEDQHAVKKLYTSPFKPANKKTKQRLIDYYQQHFVIDIQQKGYELFERENELWLFPQTISKINSYIRINRAGIKLADIFPNKVRSSHDFVCCLGEQAKKQVASIDDLQLMELIRGKNIQLSDKVSEKIVCGEVILNYQNHPIAIGQNKNGQVKNNLPRNLVKDNFKV